MSLKNTIILFQMLAPTATTCGKFLDHFPSPFMFITDLRFSKVLYEFFFFFLFLISYMRTISAACTLINPKNYAVINYLDCSIGNIY